MNYLSTISILPNTPTYPNSSKFSAQSSTKVILVRHARTTYNEQGRYQGSSDESVLTDKGRETAYQTGLALQKFGFDAIYSSPLTRVKQTTQEIVSAWEKSASDIPPVLIDSKLTEIHMSDWQGLYYQEVKEKFPEAYSCWQDTPHFFTRNGFCFPVLQLFQQARQFWQELLKKHRGQTILVVAHGGTNRALISTAIGLSPEHYHSVQQSNCGISCLEFNNSDHAQLNYLNVTNHLGENLPKLKAGKTGWRWLLLSNTLSEDLSNCSYLPDLITEDSINLILSDSSVSSEFLALKLSNNSNKTIHLPMPSDCFLESWQRTIINRQQLDSGSNESSLVTGLIIVSENILDQILQKTLGISHPSIATNHLSVIHYPQGNRQSILQGVLPINRQLISIKPYLT